MRVARRYFISGRVQGVGFRYFTLAAGQRERLHGSVRNLPDGRVEVECEGDADAIGRFERAIAAGPPGARVSHVDTVRLEPTASEPGDPRFTIR